MRASDILALWGHKSNCHEILREDCDSLERMSASTASKYVDIIGNFGDSCSFIINTDRGNNDKKTKVTSLAGWKQLDNVDICIVKHGGGVRINVAGNNNKIFVGTFGYAFNADINIWSNSSTIISDAATCNGARIVLDNSSVLIGVPAACCRMTF